MKLFREFNTFFLLSTIPIIFCGSFIALDSTIYASQFNENTKGKNQKYRNYEAGVTKSEKKCIREIVTTLAGESLWKIGKQKSRLKELGSKIENIHPFCFLSTLFSDEELKAGAQAIGDRTSWIKNGFFEGIFGSLQSEYDRGNLMPFVSDFARRLNIKEELILSTIQKNQWKELIQILFKSIPRAYDQNRYKM